MGRNDMLSIEEVHLFTPFRYDDDPEDVVWMLIGAPATKAGHHFFGLIIKRGYVYCETAPSILTLVEPVRDVSINDFIKAILSKCEWDKQQIMAFIIGMGKDGRNQDNLKDFT